MNTQLDLSPILFSADFEGTETLRSIRGVIPAELSGTYYLNGPGHFQSGDFRYRHWLDGDGYIRALTFANGKAELTSRFVRTHKLSEETSAGKPIFRAFGTSFENDRLRLRMAIETPANVSCWPFAGKLLAFGEQALPWELEFGTLNTIGEFNFFKALNAITPFSAHPKIDHKQGRLCNFGIKYMMQGASLCYWEFDEEFTCRISREFPLEQPYSVHDYLVSSRYVAFHMSPYYLRSESVVRGGKNIHDALEWNPRDTNRLLIFPREGECLRPLEIELGQRGYCLHTIEAVDRDGELVLDILETSEPLYPQYLPLPRLFDEIKPCRFTRFIIDTAVWKLVSATSFETGCHLDFPSILENSPDREHVWVLGMPVEPVGQSKYYDRILKFSWEAGQIVDEYHCPDGSFIAGEPSIAEMPGGNNYLICPQWNSTSNTSAYLVFNPDNLQQGPVTHLQSDHPGNLGFHSSFDNG